MSIEESAYDATRVFDNYNEGLRWFLKQHPSQKRIFDDIWFNCYEENVIDEY